MQDDNSWLWKKGAKFKLKIIYSSEYKLLIYIDFVANYNQKKLIKEVVHLFLIRNHICLVGQVFISNRLEYITWVVVLSSTNPLAQQKSDVLLRSYFFFKIKFDNHLKNLRFHLHDLVPYLFFIYSNYVFCL